MVSGGHTTNTSSSITYTSVVSQYLVHIMLMVATLNDLEPHEANIKNSYITAPCCRSGMRAGAGNYQGVETPRILKNAKKGAQTKTTTPRRQKETGRHRSG